MGTGSSTVRKATTQDRAILDLKIQRDKLQQYRKRLAQSSSTTHALARSALASDNRTKALLYLRQKKYHESLLEKTDSQLANLEQLTADVEFAQIQKDVYFGLERGNEALQLIHKEMGGLEAVQKSMERAEEESEFQREVSDLLSNRMSREEEDAAEEELENLERQIALEDGKDILLPQTPRQKMVKSLPDVPAGRAQLVEEERTKERRQAVLE